ncbi:MAG: 3-phosphoshikimate 1-carboxyvinyltransferase [Opitutales bacterium]
MTIDISTINNGLNACITLPASKSITNRALILAALSNNKVKLENVLNSRDAKLATQCLVDLGYKLEIEGNSISVEGKGADIPNKQASLFVGNAGTAARFITALCALAKDGVYQLDSDEEMYKRPMKGLLLALENQGVKFEFKKEEYCFPFTMYTSSITGGNLKVDARLSSQILSALLMIMPFASQDSVLELEGKTVSYPFLDMTLNMMKQFGFQASKDGDKFLVKNILPLNHLSEYFIEPDATAASYPISLSAIHSGAILIKDYAKCVLQGDTAFEKLLSKENIINTQIVGDDILVRKGSAITEDKSYDFNAFSDTFLSLATIATTMPHSIEITGISHTRKQETDRISAMATELSKITKAEESPDALKIYPLEALKKSINIDTYKDHRVAMSFGVLGSLNLNEGKPWISINDPETCSKTWPTFFEALEQIKKDSKIFKTVAIDGGAAVGKSSVSKEAAACLNYMHVDTGAHYRTLSYILLSKGLSTSSSIEEVEEVLAKIEIGTDIINQNQARITIAGELIEDALIRTKEINESVAVFASMPIIREFLKAYQRSMAQVALDKGFNGLIMEGRDITSVILPEASTKIFLDANPEIRELRRAKEGISDSIAKRDKLDSNRKTAPLICSEGTTLIDTSYMTKDEVVATAIALILSSKN